MLNSKVGIHRHIHRKTRARSGNLVTFLCFSNASFPCLGIILDAWVVANRERRAWSLGPRASNIEPSLFFSISRLSRLPQACPLISVSRASTVALCCTCSSPVLLLRSLDSDLSLRDPCFERTDCLKIEKDETRWSIHASHCQCNGYIKDGDDDDDVEIGHCR